MSDADGAPSFDSLVAAVGECTGASDARAEQWGVVRRGRVPVWCLALALDETDATPEWLARCGADALFVHRPWRVDLARVPADVGVVFSHEPFDARLTTGYNTALAAALGLTRLTPLGERDGRPVGMVGDVERATAGEVAARIVELFGGREVEHAGDGRPVSRVAVMSAMTDGFVREASSRGAAMYVTGQLRHPGLRAATETGMHVVALGHRRTERWGLRALARMLTERYPALRSDVSPA